MFTLMLLLSIVAELGLHLSPILWRARKFLSWLLVLAIAIATAGLYSQVFVLLAIALTAVSLFRIFNLVRILKARMHGSYLRQATRKTGLYLSGGQAVLVAIALYVPELISDLTLLFFALTQAVVAVLILASTALSVYKTRHKGINKHYSDKELPTVSVLIPARNETTELEACLHSILANDYPKLEILVLDDCSQDKTAQVIKSFAHDGVRFIKGDEPDDRWLAKNKAYDKLLSSANGDLVLFCGVDVRMGPRTIRALVTTMFNRNKSMISVMPLRFHSTLSAALIQPMRYWWELVPPRRLFNRPPVLSTCWLADRKQLQGLGGFTGVSRSIVSEGYFAREFVKDDKYSFLRSDKELDVRTVKALPEQRATAVRMTYPQVKKRPELVLLISAFEVLFLLLPFAVLFYALLSGQTQLILLSAVASVILVFNHVLIMLVSDPGNVPLALLNFPAVVVAELLIGYESMFKYEFSTVDWKGRNVCIPVMHVVPKLPPIEPKA